MSIVLDRKSAVYEDGSEGTKYGALYINITCHVQTSDIGSTVTLGYIGPRHTEVVESVPTKTRNYDGHVYCITVRQLMRLPSEGYIICSARGDVIRQEIIEPIFKLSTGDIEMILIEN